MPHRNKVKDSDPYFEIDAVTRQIKNLSTSKTTVIQYDHNSERFTFSLPRYIESHDMGESTKAEVHYTTKDAQGVYTIKDLRIDEKDETKVKCTWLLSQNVTKTPGAIRFLLRFSCVDAEGNIEYAWNTAPFVGIVVTEGIYNTEAIVEQYADVLEQWKSELGDYVELKTIWHFVDESEYDEFISSDVYAIKCDDGVVEDNKTRLLFVDRKEEENYTMNGQFNNVTITQYIFDPKEKEIRSRVGNFRYDPKVFFGEVLPEHITWGEWGTETFATDTEVVKKLDRGWKEIGTEIITQADVDKCTAEGYTGVQGKGVYCGDLTQYVELMCVVRIHSDTTSLNTTAATWFVGLSADVDTPPDDYSERMNSGYFTGYQPKLQPNQQNEIIVRSYFMDGSHLFSEHFGSDTGGFGGLVSGSIARIFEGANGRSYFPTKLEGKTTYWFASFISPSLNTKFVLPVGTTIKVYGR